MIPNSHELERNREQELARELGVDIPTARQMLANKQIQDTRILQKVNHAHREAFSSKFPGQVEHCLRLVMERLQAGLDKRGNIDVSDPATWNLSASEIQYLAAAAEHLQKIRKDL
jgi:hypothetical protein